MKIRFLKSISAKLFYYTAILVSAVIFAVSFQNSKSYQQMLLRTFQDASLDRGENIRITLENFFSSLDSQLKITLATMLSVNQVQRETTAYNFLENNRRKFVSIQVFRQAKGQPAESTLFQFTSDINSPAFESRDPKKVARKIRSYNQSWLNKNIRKNPDAKIYLKSFANRLKLPLISYAKSYENGRTGETFWAVLSLWQEPFFALLDGTNDSEITIVDKEGRIFSSKDIDSLKKGITLKRTKLFQKAKSDTQGLGSAFIGSYKGRKGIRWLGSYQKIDSLGLIVFMEKNEDALIRDIDALVIRTAKWGLLFVLIALAFSAIGSTTITHNLKNVINITQMIAKGDFSARIKPSSTDEIGYLALSVNSMADRIGHLLTEKVEKARFEKELETANAVQNTLFPKKSLDTESIDVVGFSKPASECGGDWWGYFQQPNGKTFILIADAMGHGVPAALVTAMAYANCMSLQAIAEESHLENELTPKNFLERFNKVLFDAVEGTITMSFFALLVDTEAATVTYANAGHNFPVLLPKNPDDPRITRKSKKLQKISPITPISLKESGSILGIDRAAEFNESTMPIAAGDKIFLFTDGLIECTSEQGKVWGRKGLIHQLLTYCDRGATGLRDSIHKEAYEFFGNQPPIDDITMVVTEIKEVNTKPKPVPERESESSQESSKSAIATAAPQTAAPQTAAPEPTESEPAQPAPEVPVARAEPPEPELPVAAAPVQEPPAVATQEPEVAARTVDLDADDEETMTEIRLARTDIPLPMTILGKNRDGRQEAPEPMPLETPEQVIAQLEDISYQMEEAAQISLDDVSTDISIDLGDINLDEVASSPLTISDEQEQEQEQQPEQEQQSEQEEQVAEAEAEAEAKAKSYAQRRSFNDGDMFASKANVPLPTEEIEVEEAKEDTSDKIQASATNYLQTVDDPNKAFATKSLLDGEEAKDGDPQEGDISSIASLAELSDSSAGGHDFAELMTHVEDMVDEEAGETLQMPISALSSQSAGDEAQSAKATELDEESAGIALSDLIAEPDGDDDNTSISISAMLNRDSDEESSDTEAEAKTIADTEAEQKLAENDQDDQDDAQAQDTKPDLAS